MDRIQCLVFITVLSVLFRNISSQQCGVETYSIYRMMLKGHTYKTFKARPLSVDCMGACSYDVRCQSYNHVIPSDICELNNRTKEARPEDFVKDIDRYYVTKSSNRGKTSDSPVLPCESLLRKILYVISAHNSAHT